MKRNPDATCETCPYFRLNVTDPYDGECRRNRVELDPGDNGDEQCCGVFPCVEFSFWCGEHPDFELKE